MSIVNRSKEDIRRQITEVLKEQGKLTDLTTGSALSTFVDIGVDRFDDVFDQLTLSNSMRSISTAVGVFLDLRGSEQGLTRRQPIKASANETDRVQKFFVTSGFLADFLPSRLIPSGTKISNTDGDVVFETFGDVPFTSVDKEIFVSMQALEPGSASRAGVNFLNSHDLGTPNILTTNIKSIDNGLDTESDDAYRYRILSSANAAVGGSVRSIINAAFTDPGISDVEIRRHVAGVGTFGVELTPVGNEVLQSSVRNIQNQVFDVVSYGNRSVIFSAFPVVISLIASIRTASGLTDFVKEDLTRVAENAITAAISAIPKGGELIINRVIADVIDAADNILDAKFVSLCVDGEEQAIRDFILEEDEFFRFDDKKIRSVQVFA